MDRVDALRDAIRAYDYKAAEAWARGAFGEGLPLEDALAAVSAVMREAGDDFGCDSARLPDLLRMTDAARGALAIIEGQVLAHAQAPAHAGPVVLGTVAGDVHSMGKTMVGVFLTACGFAVVDLGISVAADRFVAAVRDSEAAMLAMSAQLTSTVGEQRRVIEALQAAGLRDRVKVMVGGGAVTAEFAAEIGADGYAATAPEAARLACELLGLDRA